MKNGLREVPIEHKITLTIEEAMLYSGIGRTKLLEITNAPNCQFVLFVGKRKLIKRRVFDDWLDKQASL